jgi:hypothetical protein
MNDKSPLLYDEYVERHFMFITSDFHLFYKRTNCLVYIPCQSCKHIKYNELIKGMVTCSKELKPFKGLCKGWTFWYKGM